MKQSQLDDTQPLYRPPTRQRGSLEQTQPVRRVPRPAAQPIRRAARNDRGSCGSALLAVVALLLVVGALALLAYAGWQWLITQPRLNVLVLGLDRRPEQGDAVRSDVMLLVTVNPAGPQIGMLSIPRDLYVDIPGAGQNRINTAHFWGENQAAGSGPALAAQTVAQNFGVPVDHTLRLDFNGFRAIVDSVGGIEVDVETAIVDDAYPTEDYGTIRIEIPAGLQHMDGETALRYARSRHGSSDFDRAHRQQQILSALARRLFEPEVWPDLPAVYQAVVGNVDTDLGPLDMLLLAVTLYRTGPDNIERRVIEREMTQAWTTPDGAAVLLPRWELIQPMVQQLFAP